MSGLECAAGTSMGRSLHCCKVELVVGWGLKPVPSPMACTEPTWLLPAAW